MLYRLLDGEGLGRLQPLPWVEETQLQATEKDLENLLVEHLLDVLFEDTPLLPIFQERQLQAEADIYALDKKGNLVIFELKRGIASEGAVAQVLKYAQDAGQWHYSELQRRFDILLEKREEPSANLAEVHREAFRLEDALTPADFNRGQHLYVVGTAADEGLILAIDYWKTRGLSIEFLPYRIYQLHGERFFEFYAVPYDRHRNRASRKGVLFDTNRTWSESAVWDMMEKGRVAAYGNAKHEVDYLYRGDVVFYYHRGCGVIAAAEVIGPVRVDDENDERFLRVSFLTPVPRRDEDMRGMDIATVFEVTGKSFFLAKTRKVPYLDPQETEKLLVDLNQFLGVGA